MEHLEYNGYDVYIDPVLHNGHVIVIIRYNGALIYKHTYIGYTMTEVRAKINDILEGKALV